MEVELKFEEPFYGVAYADFDRNSACIFKGRGDTTAKLELPLKGTSPYYVCGKQNATFFLSFSEFFFFFLRKKSEISHIILLSIF